MNSMTVSIGSVRALRLQVIFSLAVLTILPFWATARAQSSFSSAQKTVGTGLSGPSGVAVDSSGNVYIADTGNGRVLKETLSGGSYTQSEIGQGLSKPYAIAVDGSGNLYITDSGTSSVLKEALAEGSYTQSTVATDLSEPYGVAVDASGNIYIATYDQILKETPAAGSYTQSAVVNGLNQTRGLAVDAIGNLYIAEPYNRCVLKETLSRGKYAQSTITGGMNAPYGVAVDGNGNVYIDDFVYGRVLKETPATTGYTQSTITTFGLADPTGGAVDGSGNIYIADPGTNSVYIDNDPQVASGSAGDFGTIDVGSSSTSSISEIFTFVTAGTPGSIAVVMQGATGLDFTDAGTGTCKAGTAYTVGQTCTIDVNFAPTSVGSRYGAAELLDGAGNPLACGYVMGTGRGPLAAFLPGTRITIPASDLSAIAVDGSGNVFGIGPYSTQAFKETFSGGKYIETAFASGLQNPEGIAVDGSGSIYITNYGARQVVKETPSGNTYTQTVIASNVQSPVGIGVDGSGNVYISAYHALLKETPSTGGYTQTTIASGLESSAIAVDANGDVYIGEWTGSQILKETLSGGSYQQTIVASNFPVAEIALDGVGNIYAYTEAEQLLKETPSVNGYTQSTVANFLTACFGGLAVDVSGNIYYGVCTGGFGKLDLANPSLSFDATDVGWTSSDSPQTLTVESAGNTPLAFPAPAAGNNPTIAGDFSLNNTGESACPILTSAGSASTLATGAACQLQISFSPTAAGTLSGSLVFTDNALNASAPAYTTQSISLSGTAIAVAPATLTSPTPGSTLAGDSQTFVWNTGVSAGTYELRIGTSGPGSNDIFDSGVVTVTSVAAAGIPTIGATVNVRLVTNYLGNYSGTPSYESQWVDYTFTEAQPSSASVFGTVSIGSVSAAPILTSLTFAAAGTIGSSTVVTQGSPGLDFTDAGTGTCTVGGAYAAGDTCTVAINFAPKFAGLRAGAAELFDGAGNLLATALVSGIGRGPQVAFDPGNPIVTVPTVNNLQLSNPEGLALDGAGDIYIADYYSGRVVEVPADGGAATALSPTVNGMSLSRPEGVRVDAAGDLLIADTNNHRVVEIPAGSGAPTAIEPTVNGKALSSPVDVAVDGAGDLFISDESNNRVVEIPVAGTPVAIDPTVNGLTLNIPSAAVTDGAGDLFIADSGNNRVVEIPAGGGTPVAISPVVNGLGLTWVSGVALDGAGDLYIGDYQNSRVVVLPAGGGNPFAISVTTNQFGSNGPNNIVADGAGNLFMPMGDWAGGLLELQRSHPPAINFPTIIAVNTTDTIDGPQTIRLDNIGNSPLMFPALATGTNPAISPDFSLNSSGESACPLVKSGAPDATLPAGSGCLLSISFTPEVIGSLSGSLLLTDNTLNAASPSYAVQTITLSGTASIPTPAALTSPLPGSTFTNSNETFAWTDGISVTSYELRVGTTGPGSNDLYESGATTATSASVSNIPANGTTVYVQLLSTFLTVPPQSIYYTFTAASPTPAVLTTPSMGTALSSPSATFAWTPGVAVSSYELRVGTTGVGSNNVYDSGLTSFTSTTVNGIPYPGLTLYVELISSFYGAPSQSANYTFTEAPSTYGMLTSPTVGTTFTGSTQTFTWHLPLGCCGLTGGGYGGALIGTTGSGSSDLYSSGNLGPATQSVTLSNIPTDGATVYVRIWNTTAGCIGCDLYFVDDYAFTEAGGPPTPAALTAPAQGATLTGSSQTFTWSPGVGVTDYELWVGTTGVSSSNLYNSHWLTGTSATVGNIPDNGGLAYVRLWSCIDGNWQFADYSFIEPGGPTAPAALTSPTLGNPLTGYSQIFAWSPGSGVTKYALKVGVSGIGSDDLLNQGPTTSTSATVNNIPTSGGTVNVRLAWEINAAWQFADYTYTEAGGPPVPAALISPTPRSTLSGSTQTFTWSPGAGTSTYEIWVGTKGVSSSNIYYSGSTTSTTATVSNIPTNGEMVFVRLLSKIDGAWQFTDYTFVAAGTAIASTLTSPTGPTLTNPSQTFTWTTGTGVTKYALRVGTTGYGSKDIFNTGPTTATSATVNIPTGSGTIYVGLSSEIDGNWHYTAYTFTAP